MPGKLRADGVLAPVYGPGSKLFTLEVHHDGFFCGLGKNRKYLNEKISVFDYVDADSWSYAEIEYILMRLGYWGEQKLKVYWLLPGKNMSDGLRTVMSDEETIVMSQIVHKVKNIVIYLDHHDHVAGNIRDDIVPNKGTVEEEEYELDGSDSGDDSDFVDSDNEVDGGDDDLYADNVDQQVPDAGVGSGKKNAASSSKKEKGAKTVHDDIDTDDDDLLFPESDDEGQVRLNMKSFRPEDLSNPIFKLGMLFSSVELVDANFWSWWCL